MNPQEMRELAERNMRDGFTTMVRVEPADLIAVLDRADALEGGVTVKPLNWSEHASLGGRKLLAFDCFGNEFARLDLVEQSFTQIEMFRQQKQADYERHILSALSAPAQRVEEEHRMAPDEIHEYVEGYEWRHDNGGGYTPTDAEKAMIEDAINGFLAASPAPAPHEDEKWKRAFAAQSRKLQAVLHIPGVKEALADIDHTAPAPHAGVDAGPDWTKIYENVAHCPDRDSEMLTVTRETLRLAQAAIRQALDREIYHNYAAAFGEIRAALGDRPNADLSHRPGFPNCF